MDPVGFSRHKSIVFCECSNSSRGEPTAVGGGAAWFGGVADIVLIAEHTYFQVGFLLCFVGLFLVNRRTH